VEEAMLWLPDGGASVEPPPRARESTQSAGGGRHILLADDNADMREYIGRLLAPLWEVEAVGNGRAALDALRRKRPALLITDVMMPELDGFGLLHAVRADPQLRDLPVLMLSARAGEESRLEGFEAGADEYLAKPFTARELITRVEAQVLRARLRAAEEANARKIAAVGVQSNSVLSIRKVLALNRYSTVNSAKPVSQVE
jgi:DNA-binding response OmpR family regulator